MTEATSPNRVRLESVDLLRGIIMILMALDHVRDVFGNLATNPTDISTTTVPLFLTRWITHICAPVFFLLTGTGAYLAHRRMSRGELARFLLTRGLWLILLEVTLARFLWQFNVDYRLIMLTVLWALGWAMIFLAVLVHLPTWAVASIGVMMIAGHNLLDGVQASTLGAFEPAWHLLHAPGFVLNGDRVIFVAYVLIPWVGVTAVGFGLGPVFGWDIARRRRFLGRAGIGMVAAFLVLRGFNVYGDPSRWGAQSSGIFTLLSFINTSKYPPSLLFILMTLGPTLLLLRAFDGGAPRWLRPALIIGRVPLFYYLLHILLIHLLAVVVCFIRYGNAHWMFESPTLDRFPITQPPEWPARLPVIYLIWIGVVVSLYPLCHWFAEVKRRRSNAWLSYL